MMDTAKMASIQECSPSGFSNRRYAIAALLLCLSGLAVSVALTRIHVFAHTDPDYHSICALSDSINCETVALSPYSVFAGLPISVWGIVGYVLMGLFALWSLGRFRLHTTWPWGGLVVLFGFSTGVSALLAFISATRIDSFCLFCSASYAINLALLVLGVVFVRRSGLRLTGLLRADLGALAVRPLAGLSLVLFIGGTVAALQLLVTPYWRMPGWDDLPSLPVGTDGSGRHWIGAREPVLEIREFSDYECPHCRKAHKSVRVLAAKHPNNIRLLHQQLPLDMACHPGLARPFHLHACRFAEAAECAGRQGRFWQMNDALFAVQESVKAENVKPVDLAVRIGLDRSQFLQCLEQHETVDRIAKDIAEAVSLGLRGTPTFIVADRIFLGQIPEAEIAALLQRGTPSRPDGTGASAADTAEKKFSSGGGRGAP